MNDMESVASRCQVFDGEDPFKNCAGGSTVKSYSYDGMGRRESRASGGTTTHFWYDGNQLVNERVGSSWTANSVYGLGLIKRNEQYPLYDFQGNNRKVTSSGETVIQTMAYDAFGNTTNTTGSSNVSNKYVGALGYRDDGDAGLIHVGARYYDPQEGRFITRDTVLTESPYAYCNHDAVNFADPKGH